MPAARVWLQSEDVEYTDPAWMQPMRRFNDVELVLASGLGRELALDARGEIRIPRPKKELSLAAAHGTLHGEATLRPDDAECVVELKAYHPLAIEVVDRSGRGLEGVHVQLLWGTFDPLDHGYAWVTDEDGRVRIPKLEHQLWPAGYRGPVRVTLAGVKSPSSSASAGGSGGAPFGAVAGAHVSPFHTQTPTTAARTNSAAVLFQFMAGVMSDE